MWLKFATCKFKNIASGIFYYIEFLKFFKSKLEICRKFTLEFLAELFRNRQREADSRIRGQRLSPESVVWRHLSQPKRPGNPCCLTNLSESFGEERGMRPKICFSDWTLPCTREWGKKWNYGGRVERLSTPEWSKSKRFVISKGCSLMDFLFGLNLKSSVVCITRDGEGKLALLFYAIMWI